jgi:hypothetical protein
LPVSVLPVSVLAATSFSAAAGIPDLTKWVVLDFATGLLLLISDFFVMAIVVSPKKNFLISFLRPTYVHLVCQTRAADKSFYNSMNPLRLSRLWIFPHRPD